MKLDRRPLAFLHEPSTPIADRLHLITGDEPLATWNRDRATGSRFVGGEWDTLRATPLRVRRSLTSAGYLRRGGLLPDEFVDLLRRGGVSAVDPIAWYVNEARRAMIETRHARRVGRETALARTNGHETIFQHRDALARQRGHASYWHYRKAMKWT